MVFLFMVESSVLSGRELVTVPLGEDVFPAPMIRLARLYRVAGGGGAM
jgi:hypothetical protein